ncbi:glycoside hydrolase family 48 protein [Echinimonas agarilytica]|uniref:PKD domain-containing protein n=1 Tax=Echinimonas agarilytica TaxID=1215918 RepID=A0AA42B8V4_9GAMM|nr:glycoside hydrolase family 48 protein [Echinimonas agarilytica]MCM2681399.1 PKD domain-containing protein [Echinimonas agarilytica]
MEQRKRIGLSIFRPKKTWYLASAISLAFIPLLTHQALADPAEYPSRFDELWAEIHDDANGYFSADGGPYHSIETFVVEAPDHGHESTSEAYSYWLWLEAVKGKRSGDWSHFRNAWQKMEEQIIPTDQMQPTGCSYDPSAPATYVPEGLLPSDYPGPLKASVSVGEDPISADLRAQYGTCSIYAMHWLLDMDNVYGYGNFGDGTSTPSYINTFQRGQEESVWETVPHPSWEDFTWGGEFGFLDLFVKESNDPSPQWRYTNAPDADARVLQVMYWVLEWLEEQGKDPNEEIPGLVEKATKMGDYLRLAMFDKYFKTMGAQSESAPAGQGFESAHYLMSWYFAWGGPIDESQEWGFRIGSSHVHFGYQNLMAAHALTQIDTLKPQTPNAVSNWETSLERKLEFYQWLQSKEGAIAGGATNSWNGKYDAFPADRADRTFYGMVYDEDPVYHDPGSGTWFGWQAWSMERVAEYYYVTGNTTAEDIMDKWIGWVMANIHLLPNGEVEVPVGLSWSGLPEAWDPQNPKKNTELSVEITSWNQDIGVIASMTKALMYYAAAKREHTGSVDVAVRDMSVEILNRIWDSFRDDKGLAAPETRGDFGRLTDPVYIPDNWNGVMPNGDLVNKDSTFSSIRSFYQDDPGYVATMEAVENGDDPTFYYHRFWAQVDAAVAYGLFDDLFPNICSENCVPIAQAVTAGVLVGESVVVTLSGSDSNGDIVSYSVTPPAATEGSVLQNGTQVTFTPAANFAGDSLFSYTVTDDESLTSEPASITISVVDPAQNQAPVPCFVVDPTSGIEGKPLSFDASCSTDAEDDSLLYEWDFGDGVTDVGKQASHIFDAVGNYAVTLTVRDLYAGTVLHTETTTASVAVAPQPEGTSCAIGDANVWGNGFVLNELSVVNIGTQPLNGWTATLELDRPVQVTGSWNVSIAQEGNVLTFTNPVPITLQPGDTAPLFGLQGAYTGSQMTIPDCMGSAESGGGDINIVPQGEFTAIVGGLEVSLDASASTDADGDSMSFSWDLGDGQSASGVSLNHTYAASGSYEVVLTVTDGQGGSDLVSQIVNVSGGLSSPPNAMFSSDVNNLSLSVDASSSTDADGDIASYQWDFGDGTTASGMTASHSYSVAGSYSVTLVVTDEEGLFDTEIGEVVAQDPVQPKGNCEYSIDNQWGGGFVASIRITNTGTTAVNGWQIGWEYSDGSTVSSSWNTNLSGSNPYIITPLSWNSTIQPGQSIEFGVQGNKGILDSSAQIPVITGDVCD